MIGRLIGFGGWTELVAELSWLIGGGILTWLTVWRVREYTLAHRILDVPNARSSHVQPTPRGGGLGIVFTLELALVVMWWRAAIDTSVMLALGLGGLAIALVGHLDDRRGVTAGRRLCVHLASAVLALWLLSRQPGSQLPFEDIPRWITYALLAVGIVWSTNLFNFMDGTDGLAASEGLFVSLSTAVLIALHGAHDRWVTLPLIAAGANLGFLIWNWPPAKIFMGDVGSGFLGFWFSALAVALHFSGVLSVWTSVCLASIFIADATVTLLVRASRHERVHEAHRSHVYQRLARRFASHAKVAVLVWAINLLVVLPVAYFVSVSDRVAPWLTVGLLLVLSSGCLLLKAGARD